MLILNGVKVPGHNLTVRANFRIETKELSGQTSASDRSAEGIKPMTFSVALEIPCNHPGDLGRVIALARSTDGSGNMTIYQIVNCTAEACKIREVTFTDQFTVTEQSRINSWQVGFILVEYRSIPEKVEQRQPQPVTVEQNAGQNVETTVPQPINNQEQLTGFLSVLKKVDEALA